MLGLADSEILGGLSNSFAEEDVGSSVAALRSLAKLCELHKDDCIIRYIPSDPLGPELREEVGPNMLPEYTTAIPHEKPTMKHDRDGELIHDERHTYWIYIDCMTKPEDQI